MQSGIGVRCNIHKAAKEMGAFLHPHGNGWISPPSMLKDYLHILQRCITDYYAHPSVEPEKRTPSEKNNSE